MKDFITRIALRGAGLGTEIAPRAPEPSVLALPVAEEPSRPNAVSPGRGGQRPPSADPSAGQDGVADPRRRDPEPLHSPPASVPAQSGSGEGKPASRSPQPNAAMTDKARSGARNRSTNRHVAAVHRAASVPSVAEVPVTSAAWVPVPVKPAEPPERLQAPERVGQEPNVRSASSEAESATVVRPDRGRGESKQSVEGVAPIRPEPQPVDARLRAAVRSGEKHGAPVLAAPDGVSGPTIEVTIGTVEIIAPEPDFDPALPPARPAPDFRYMDDARSYADRRWY